MSSAIVPMSLLLLSLSAAVAAPWKGEAAVAFAGTSTLHDWAGVARALPFEAEVDASAEGPARLRAVVRLPVAGMDTDNDARDENLRKVMRAAEHREILGRAEVRSEAGRFPSEVNLELVVLGKARAVRARAVNWVVGPDRLSVDLEFPVSLDAWGVERPSFLMFIRVGDEVRVRVHVEIARS